MKPNPMLQMGTIKTAPAPSIRRAITLVKHPVRVSNSAVAVAITDAAIAYVDAAHVGAAFMTCKSHSKAV